MEAKGVNERQFIYVVGKIMVHIHDKEVCGV